MPKKRGKQVRGKVSSKRKTVKKSNPKKKGAIKTKHTCLLMMQDCSPKNYFVLNDGRTLKNPLELVDALDDISLDVFSYHVNVFKNDFANWIRDVYCAPDLADDLLGCFDNRSCQVVILKYMVNQIKGCCH